MNTNPETVDEYIASFPEETQAKLNTIRALIRQNAPQSEERISYGMPAYSMNGKPLVYFAGFNKHIGFYATPSGHEAFKVALSSYKQGKGSVQFPLNQPLPIEVIIEIIRFKVAITLKNSK